MDLALIERGIAALPEKSGTKAGMKEAEGNSLDLWFVEPSKLKVLTGFNPRVNTEKYAARIQSLARSMWSEGFYRDKPLAGYCAIENGEKVIYIYGGHTRLAAALIALSHPENFATNANFTKVPVTIDPERVSLVSITVGLINGNTEASLTIYETAVVCQRLIGMGLSKEDIAKSIDCSKQHVSNLLTLMQAPFEIREMVANEVIAGTLAIDLIAEYGEGALAQLQLAADKANGEGKTKITKRHLESHPFKSFLKKKANVMATTLKGVKSDPAFNSLLPETRVMLEELLTEMEQAESGASSTSDPRQKSIFEEQASAS